MLLRWAMWPLDLTFGEREFLIIEKRKFFIVFGMFYKKKLYKCMLSNNEPKKYLDKE